MQPDIEGFLYPHIDETHCINCGLCAKSCSFIQPYEKIIPQNVYAAKNPSDEIRKQSSSGGIFYILAKHILSVGGVVFGARFDDSFQVIHDYAETEESAKRFIGSKYVQSDIGNTYKLAENFLKQNRNVLFTGTPCQIAGLKHYLKKDYKHLICADVVCHGVPSPAIWSEYLAYCKEQLRNRHNQDIEIIHVNFRSKIDSWEKYAFSIQYKLCATAEIREFVDYDSAYMKAFGANIICRPSCFHCKAKGFCSGSDITLGDYWGIKEIMPDFVDKLGVSLTTCNTNKGIELINNLPLELAVSKYEDIIMGNPCIIEPIPETRSRADFWKKRDIPLIQRIHSCIKVSFYKRVKNTLYDMADKLNLLSYYKLVKKFIINK